MEITIFDWANGGVLLNGTGYTHNQVVDGTEDDAFKIAIDLFKYGRNVMLAHETPGVTVFVDNKKFSQR